MKAVPFQGANVVMVYPGCGDLPVMRGGGQLISTWEMDQNEVAKLLNGGKVRLSILGDQHPPVALWVE